MYADLSRPTSSSSSLPPGNRTRQTAGYICGQGTKDYRPDHPETTMRGSLSFFFKATREGDTTSTPGFFPLVCGGGGFNAGRGKSSV